MCKKTNIVSKLDVSMNARVYVEMHFAVIIFKGNHSTRPDAPSLSFERPMTTRGSDCRRRNTDSTLKTKDFNSVHV